jgi:aryl-phospho-beta-D-glucosidase BglC (GH1 family)
MLTSKKILTLGLVLAILLGGLGFLGNRGFTFAANAANTPVSYFGEMVVSGNHINGSKTNAPMQVQGMSFFWSNWSGQYWNAAIVDRMVDEFKCEIVRAAYGVDDQGNPYNPADEDKVREVVREAIKKGIYVIIDWHSHGAYKNPSAAKDFFSKMAREFGGNDNVIFELFNEPTQVSWGTVKSYAEQVIPVIREYSNNLIVVGSPTWSQDVDAAANDPIRAANIAYTLHFYAGTHKQYLRDKGNNAMQRGLALFVTEWGSCNADGNGGIDYASTSDWQNWMNQNKISSCNWAINDKAETSSIFSGSGLSEAGNYLKSIFDAHSKTAVWRGRGQDSTNTTTIKALANGKYVCADADHKGVLIGDRSVADTWEKYEKIANNDGTISLRSLVNNKYVCADLNEDSKLIARSDSIDTWEKFKVVNMGNGNIALQALANNKYVSCDLDRGAALYANRDNPSTWETFILSNAALNGVYKITCKCSGKVLDVQDCSTADGAKLQQWTGGNGDNQKFRVEMQADGYYKITVQHSGKVLDVPSGASNNGVQLQQYSDNGSAAQRWQIIDDGNGYYKVISKASGLAMDVASASTADGAAVQQYTDNGTDAQRWSFAPVSGSN